MNNFDRMMFKIMFGLMMRSLFLILRLHNNQATKLVGEYQAFTRPDGALDKWGTVADAIATRPVPSEVEKPL